MMQAREKMEVLEKEIEKMEAEQIALAENRQDFYGVHKMPSNGRIANFTPNTGLTKGVRSGRMKTFYQEGRGPKVEMLAKVKVEDIVLFIFKGVETVGLVESFNEATFTVTIAGLDRKKAVGYNKYRRLVG